MSDLIRFDAVHFAYRGDWLQRIPVLHGISFAVPAGCALGYLGANGAGKSTSIKLLLGLLNGHTGTITCLGEPIGDPRIRRRIGYLPEHPYFYENLQVQEYLRYLGALSGMTRQEIAQACERLYEDLDLGELRRHKLGSFSKGMRQRFGLAQAILHRPDLIVLDEPFSGLDPLWRARFKQVLAAERARGATLFFSSHILADVEDLCDRYVLIDHGHILEQGTLGDLFAQAPLHAIGRGPAPPDAQPQEDGTWMCACTEEERPEVLAAIATAGGELLRLERQRIALEDYFVARVREHHAAANTAEIHP